MRRCTPLSVVCLAAVPLYCILSPVPFVCHQMLWAWCQYAVSFTNFIPTNLWAFVVVADSHLSVSCCSHVSVVANIVSYKWAWLLMWPCGGPMLLGGPACRNAALWLEEAKLGWMSSVQYIEQEARGTGLECLSLILYPSLSFPLLSLTLKHTYTVFSGTQKSLFITTTPLMLFVLTAARRRSVCDLNGCRLSIYKHDNCGSLQVLQDVGSFHIWCWIVELLQTWFKCIRESNKKLVLVSKVCFKAPSHTPHTHSKSKRGKCVSNCQ